MRAVVTGGGIVGLTTGIALRRAGFDVVVHERAPEIRAAGAGLGLWANALAVLDDLGVGDQVRAIGKPSEMRFHDPSGTLLETPGTTTATTGTCWCTARACWTSSRTPSGGTASAWTAASRRTRSTTTT
nr:hypothetical protein GCM10025730_03460 [Promicromonospora thailandica]